MVYVHTILRDVAGLFKVGRLVAYGQCAGAQIWPRLACASCWISLRLRRGLAAVFVAVVAHARYGHPLRFYITPHCPQCPPVAALKLRLVPVTASRPIG